jgi:hypothetical protein
LILKKFMEITGWVFVYQERYVFSALIALNLIVNQSARRHPELWLFLLIVLFSGYSFSLLFFLPRYLLPALPYLYLTGTWSLMELVRPPWKTPAAVVTLSLMVWSLATQPFTDNAEFNLKYVDAVRVHKEMCEFITSEFPDSRILTAWPHDRQLRQPHLGYVKESPSVASFGNNHDLREYDLILVMVTPETAAMAKLKAYAVKNDWRLLTRLAKEPVVTELYGRPQ